MVDLVDTDKLLVLVEERKLSVSAGVNVQLIVYVPTCRTLLEFNVVPLVENAKDPWTPLLIVVPEMNELIFVS